MKYILFIPLNIPIRYVQLFVNLYDHDYNKV